MPSLFATYAIASADYGQRYLDLRLFNSTYAAILYAHFDANADGFLSYAEAQKALQFIDPMAQAGGAVDVAEADGDDGEHEVVPVGVAFPAHAFTSSGDLRLDADWFWSVYQRMG